MVSVFEDIGLPVEVRLDDGVLHVEMAAALGGEAPRGWRSVIAAPRWPD
jgi:hypothetical protein